MAQIKWSLQANDDIESIAEYIGKDSEKYASLFVHKVIDSVQRLIDFPDSGRIVPELNNCTIRELIIGNYRIIYRFKKDIIEILTIYHSARSLSEL